MKSRHFLFFSLFLLAACTSSSGQKFAVNKVTQIRTGVTTKSDVMNQLGTPLSRINVNGAETWQYSYMQVSTSMGAQAFLPVVGPFLPGANSTSYQAQSLTINFSGDVVSKCSLTITSTNSTSQGGLATGITQPINPSSDVQIRDCAP
jgi:outer membrane protein assembly factor BamE (lipoprotein component of BamABCDE complex)